MNNVTTSSDSTGLEVAIIGMAGRFPGAKNIDEFWRNLRDGIESVSVFSDEELVSSGVDSGVLSHPNYVKAGVVLDDVELFDASFFGYTPKEAEITDPQHRLFLECASDALENAGYNSQKYESPVGVYAGVSMNTYLLNNLYSNRDQLEAVGIFQIMVSNDKDHLATLVSYKLNLTGPSVTVQTACSTSLVAVHLACQSLLSGDCEMALAGGVSIPLPQKGGYLYQEGGILSPDGHCRAFDAKAKGTIAGMGVGIVVLKRLDLAIADGDRIEAVIKGSAINNDGSLKVGYTAPSIEGQAKVIQTAQVTAEIEAETVTYIEAHGTGTTLGDPIEIEALTQAFRASTEKKGFCAIGSLKTNIGHLDAAAGVAGLIKTVLALKHKFLPPSLHFEAPNPAIDFANSPFYVNSTLSEWTSERFPRRAGVSSFGIGGTNAHVVLEEAPTLEASGKSRPWQLLVLSAKTSSALDTATTNLLNHLKQHPNVKLADVAYTLEIGREEFSQRRMLVCRDLDDAVNTLETLEPKRIFTQFQETRERPVAFMFSGQGTQYANMASELYQVEPTFRSSVDLCCELLKPHLGLDLRHVLYPSEEQVEQATQQLKQTAITQPALFVIEYALAKLWMEWGVRPQAMIGHSIGEYVAACLAGVFSLEEALMLVATRGQLMQGLPAGTMMAVPLSADEVQPILGEKLSLAAINGPSLCVVSGSTEAVAQLESQLIEKGIGVRRLHTSHAFHSEMMAPILEPFTLAVKKVNLKPPEIPYLSNVTGTWITADQATNPNYWATHLRSSVRFAEGVQLLLQEPERILLEVGPGRTLSTLAMQYADKAAQSVVLTSVRHPQESQSDIEFLLTTLGKLWLAGVQVDWSGFYAHEQRHRLPLPTYPFERQRYWIEPQQQLDDNRGSQGTLSKKPDIADWFYLPFWKQSVPPALLRQGNLTERKSCWLVFVDECGLGSQIVKRLEQDGQNVISVKVGSEFTEHSDCVYTLDPRQPNNYEVLLNELLAKDKIPTTIVHLWSVRPNEQPESGVEWVDKAQDFGFYSLLFLAQAIGKQNLTDEFQITVVSNNMQNVTGEESLCPEKATVLGPCKVIPQEYPNLTCRSVDVVVPQSGTRNERKLIDQLWDELQAKSSELVIAYRGNHRWVQTFEPVRWDKALKETPRLRERGVYLITGGLGSIGLVLAEHLAQTVQAKLLLTGRSAFPARDEWEQWLTTHDECDRISRKIRKVQELEELGAEVLVAIADVANQQQMQEAITQAEEQFGQLNGVIHAAGMVAEESFRWIEESSYTECEQQFQPKVHGLLVLEQVLQERELDFCLLLSSLSSVLGGLGFVAYSAANLFMDAFVHQHNQTHQVPWFSVNWDGWQFGEQKKQSTSFGADLAELSITPKEGVNVFERILSGGELNQVVVSTGDLQARIDQWIKLESLQSPGHFKKKDSSSLHSRPNLPNPYVAPRNQLERTVTDIWQDLLGIEPIGIYDNFLELGGHSLLATQLISRVREALQVELPIRSLLEEPTVASLVEHIETSRWAAQALQFPLSDTEGDLEEGEI
jgi:acyl transferase domain-containing protein